MPPAWGVAIKCFGRLLPVIEVKWTRPHYQLWNSYSPMTRYEYNKRYTERRILRGLCIDCGQKRDGGKSRCVSCLRKRSLRRIESQPLYCGECNQLIRSEERTGRIFHKKCAEKRQAKKYPEQHRLATLAYQRRHREKGLWKCCPRKVFKGGLCRRHHGMERQRKLEKRAS